YTLHYFPINITNPIDIYILSLHDALPILNVQSIDDAVENETTLNLKDPDTIKRLEKQLEERIDKRIRTALEHVQQDMQADILGVGEVFHRQYPGKWAKVKDNWNEATFPEITVNNKSDVNIKRPGRSTSPPAVPDDEVTDK